MQTDEEQKGCFPSGPFSLSVTFSSEALWLGYPLIFHLPDQPLSSGSWMRSFFPLLRSAGDPYGFILSLFLIHIHLLERFHGFKCHQFPKCTSPDLNIPQDFRCSCCLDMIIWISSLSHNSQPPPPNMLPSGDGIIDLSWNLPSLTCISLSYFSLFYICLGCI